MKVILVSAVSLDAKIGRDFFDKLDWVSLENKQFFGQASRRAGVVILGHNTLKTIKKPLKGRLVVVLTSKPEKEKPVPGKVEFTNQAPGKILAALEARGFKEAILGGGRKINSLFLKENLIDEIWLVVEPVVLGKGIGLFEEGVPGLEFKLLEVEKIGHRLVGLKYGRE